MIRASYLRVYLPRDRAGDWAPHPGSTHRRFRIDDRFVWDEPMSDDAFTTTWKQHHYICPRYPRLRMLEGALAFNRMYPGANLLPEGTIRSITNELENIRTRRPSARSHILTSPWHVPLRWFSAFDPEERELYETSNGTSIRYRTDVGTAQDRVERSVEILDEAGFDETIVDQVKDLSKWLRGFPRDAMVELDYARVGELFSGGDLVLDDSAADVKASLQALANDDYDQAGLHYAAVATRWAHAQALTYVN